MGRWKWKAGAGSSRQHSAVYEERGFENTTVAEIAQRAGLTERTFFRHFADKRGVQRQAVMAANGELRQLPQLIRVSLAELKAVTAGR